MCHISDGTRLRVAVSYGGRKYSIQGSFASQAQADHAKDLLILLMHEVGITRVVGRKPVLKQPPSAYYVPGLAVLNIPSSLRPKLAAALQVS